MQFSKNNKSTSGRANAGFTLLELLVVLAIVGIVTVVAVPAMGRWVAQYRLAGATNEMVAAIRLTQHQAMTRKRELWFCAQHRQRSGCGSSSKNVQRWLVAVPSLGQVSASGNEELVRQVDISPSLQVKDNLLNDTVLKVAPSGRFFKTETRDIFIRICAPQLAGREGTREISTQGAVIHVIKSDAGCA